MLGAYWRDSMSDAMRSKTLALWCDELEDWPIHSIEAALRQWVRENPDKRPNFGHIVQLLKRAWGEHNAPAVRAALAPPRPVVQVPPLEKRRAICAELAERFPLLAKRIEPPRERASAAETQAMVDQMQDPEA